MTQGRFSKHMGANLLGRAWAFLSNFAFIPAYVHVLGIESYGVIALFLAIAGLIAFLDMGFSPTLARELHDQRRTRPEKAGLLFTYEVAYACIVGVVIAGAVFLPLQAFGVVVSAEDLAKPEVSSSVRLILAAAAVQMIFNFYVAGLMGIEEQVKGNVIQVGGGLVRSGMVLIPLLLFPSPTVFLAWQLGSSLLFAAIGRSLLYRAIDPGAGPRHARFNLQTIASNLAFSGGMFLVSVTAAVNTNIDKLILGRLEGLGALAGYSLVATFSQLLVFAISPVTITVLPRFVRYASSGQAEGVRELFIVTYKLVAAVVCAVLVTMLLFGPYLVSLWTAGNLEAARIAGFAPGLIIGYALLALGTVVHCVAVANKKLKGSMTIGLTMLLTAPAYWLAIRHHGLLGAAVVWAMLQAVVVPWYMWWVNRHLLQLAAPGRLFLGTLLIPLGIALLVNLAAAQLVSAANATVVNLAIIILAALASSFACVWSVLDARDRRFLMQAAD